MKKMKITFRQIREDQEVAEKQVNEAFDTLFFEVMKRLEMKTINYPINSVKIGGGE